MGENGWKGGKKKQERRETGKGSEKTSGETLGGKEKKIKVRNEIFAITTHRAVLEIYKSKISVTGYHLFSVMYLIRSNIIELEQNHTIYTASFMTWYDPSSTRGLVGHI